MTRYSLEVLAPLTAAKTIAINSAADYVRAGELKVVTREMRKKITAWFRGTPVDPGPIPKAHALWQDLCKKEREALAPLQQTDDLLERKMLAWQREEKARAAAEQRAEAQLHRRRAEDARLEEAAQREADGDSEAADELLDLPLDLAPTYVAPDVPKVAGVVSKQELVLTVDDKRTLILAVAAAEMLDVMHANPKTFTEEGWRAVDAFLREFAPVRAGLHYLDACDAKLKTDARHRGEAFKVAGVTAAWKDVIV